MKTPERFDRAIKALVQAFFNDHLAKWNCGACAVGNIVAAGMGIKPTMQPTHNVNGYWNSVVNSNIGLCANSYEEASNFYMGFLRKLDYASYIKGVENISVTGYTPQELFIIEKAFENNTRIKHEKYPITTKQKIMQDQFNGLMAVVEVL